MQDKDVTEKMLEKYNDVFADILNVLLFDGKNVVDESSLSDALPMSMLKIGSNVRLQERDIAKYWQNSKINISLFGLENQTRPDKLMPLRVFGYDGTEYVNQTRKENRYKEKYPVITLVLYLGYDKSKFSFLLFSCKCNPFIWNSNEESVFLQLWQMIR